MDLILLIFLTYYNGKLALQKGLKPFTWRVNTVVAWLIGQTVGFIVALQFYSVEDLSNPIKYLKAGLISIPFAFAGFHLIYHNLQKRPDAKSTDFDQKN